MTLEGRSRKHTWDIYWSPEGRKIATVEAITARKAIRKAPMPYRRYLGEMYAVATDPNAYIAVIRILSDGLLLGGLRHHSSTPFELEDHARQWAIQAIEVNRNRPGFENADIRYEIVGTYANNPIRAEEINPVRCDQCEALMINGVFCHETGCPNVNARYDADSGEWIKQRKCFECGGTVDADAECCNGLDESDFQSTEEN